MVIYSFVVKLVFLYSTLQIQATHTVAQTPISCAVGESLFKLNVQTDVKGSNISWEVVDVAYGKPRFKSPVYTNEAKSYSHQKCYDDKSCYKFVIRNLDGDSLQKSETNYTATFGGTLVAASMGHRVYSSDGGDFGTLCRLDSNGRTIEVFGNSGGSSDYGYMFDVRAKEKQELMIFRFAAIHTKRIMNYKYRVYTKNGSYRGYEQNPTVWTLVGDATVMGAGANQYTGTASFKSPDFVTVLAETTQAFYVVLDQPDLVYTNGAGLGLQPGTLSHSFGNLNVFAGVATGKDFSGPTGNTAVVNGKISIGYTTVYATGSPTKSPFPVTSSPTAAPFDQEHLDCNEFESIASIKIQTDDFGSETTWDIVDVYGANKLIKSGGPYPDKVKTYQLDFCLELNGCYKFVLRDSKADGIKGDGRGATVIWDDVVQMKPVPGYSPAFSSIGVDFGRMCFPDGGEILSVGRTGDRKSQAIMFDIKAKKNVMIKRFNFVHIADTEKYNLKVYTKNGSYKGYENDPTHWILVQDIKVAGSGSTAYTSIANFAGNQAVPILSETTQAFYVVLDKPGLMFSDPGTLKEADVWKSFDEMDVLVGGFTDSVFGAFGGLAGFDGQLEYAPARVNSTLATA